MRSFLGIQAFPYQGKLIRQPLQLGGLSKWPPCVVPIIIDWNVPWNAAGNPANVGVLLNLLTGAVSQPLDLIKSVYIDNTNSSVPIYVRFPSTGMTIVAAPNTDGWYPAITQDLNVQVFAEGLTAGSIPTTGIWFTNVLIDAYSDPEINQAVALWLASASISRGTTILNTNFGAPALGDQTINFMDPTGGVTGILHDNIWGTPLASGFIYLTHCFVTVDTTAILTLIWVVQSTGPAGVLYTFENAFTAGFKEILDMQGMNVKLDATQKWQIKINTNTGAANTSVLNHSFTWTTNPN